MDCGAESIETIRGFFKGGEGGGSMAALGSLKSRQKSSLFPLCHRQALLIQCRLGQMVAGTLFFIRNSNAYRKRHSQ
jgi:hypothetical protein